MEFFIKDFINFLKIYNFNETILDKKYHFTKSGVNNTFTIDILKNNEINIKHKRNNCNEEEIKTYKVDEGIKFIINRIDQNINGVLIKKDFFIQELLKNAFIEKRISDDEVIYVKDKIMIKHFITKDIFTFLDSEINLTQYNLQKIIELSVTMEIDFKL